MVGLGYPNHQAFIHILGTDEFGVLPQGGVTYMRTLKRTLCLVLAMVMVLGMFGIASATSFKDDGKVQYKEAVDVMTGIGSINGMGDGTFNPAGNVTRAQAAKMVAYAVLGADVAKNLPVSASSFKDVDSNFNWAIPSIEYLVKAGVINGRGNGTFDPNGKVTAYEIAKMLLVAAGYGKNGEFTGNSWVLNVAITAQKQGVFTGSKTTDRNAPATREECALYCFNVLTTVQKVVYDKTKDTYVDDNTTTTLADEVYKMQPVAEGVLTANQANSTNKYTTVGGVNYNIETGLDLVGHFVRVYYKSAHTGAATPGVTYAVVDLSTKVEVAKDITTAAAWNTAFGTGTVTNSLAASTNLFTDYTASTGAIPATFTIGSAAKAGTYILYKGDVKSYIASATYTVDTVASYTAPTATATGKIDFAGATPDITVPKTGDTTSPTALAYAAYSVYETPAAKDVVIVQATGARTAITKAATATGKVTAVNTSATKTLTMGGKTYSESTKFTSPSGFAAWTANDLLNKDCTIFLGTDGKVVLAKVSSGTTDAGLVYVTAKYEKSVDTGYGANVTYWAQGVDMNGKEVSYQLTETVYNTVDATYKTKLCTVSTSYDATLKATVASFALASAGNSSTAFTGSSTTALKATDIKIGSNYYFDANTKFIFVKNSLNDLKVTTATGAQATNGTDTYFYYAAKAATDTNFTIKYVVVGGTPAATSSESLMFVPQAFTADTAVSYTKADGTPGTAYKNVAFIDGQPKLDVLMTNVAGIGVGFYNFAKDSAGIYTLTPAAKDVEAGSVCSSGLITNVYGNLVTIKGANLAVADASAANAFIVDVPYLADMLQNNGANGLTQHNTLSSLNGTTVYYSFTTAADGSKTVTGIYYMGKVTFTAQPTSLTSAGNLTATATATTGAIAQYAWMKSTDSGKTWTSAGSGATLAVSSSADNGLYYCQASTAEGLTGVSNIVSVTIS
jgi:hypothetical protein